MLRRTASVRTHYAESVCIVNHETERILLLQRHNLVENTQRTGHTEHTFRDYEYATALFVCNLASASEHFLAIDDIVVTEFELLADMQTYTVQQARMRLCVIDYYIMAAYERINRGQYTLISEVEQERSLFLFERSKATLHLLVQGRLTGHHTTTHWISHTPLRSRFGIRLAYLGMVS